MELEPLLDSLAVLAGQEPEALEVLLAAAVHNEAHTVVEGLHFGVRDRQVAVGGQLLNLGGLGGDYPEVFLPLFGEHQAHNAAVALAAVESFFGVSRADESDGPGDPGAAPAPTRNHR